MRHSTCDIVYAGKELKRGSSRKIVAFFFAVNSGKRFDGHYTMGATGVRVTEYDQTKAMENADLIIANCFANGRAVDDNVAVIFDVTKLEEYVINVHQTSTASV